MALGSRRRFLVATKRKAKTLLGKSTPSRAAKYKECRISSLCSAKCAVGAPRHGHHGGALWGTAGIRRCERSGGGAGARLFAPSSTVRKVLASRRRCWHLAVGAILAVDGGGGSRVRLCGSPDGGPWGFMGSLSCGFDSRAAVRTMRI